MSVLDEARAFEQRIADRLVELEPLVREYQELKQLKERLGRPGGDAQEVASAAPPSATRTTSRTAGRKQPSRRRRAGSTSSSKKRTALPPGHRQATVLDAIRAQPGITVRELGKQLEVDPTGLYRVVRRLEAAGTVRRDGAKAFATDTSD